MATVNSHDRGGMQNVARLAAVLVILSALTAVSRGQKSTTNPIEICSADGYDINNLTLADFWQFESKDKCINSNGSCSFFFSFCKPLPPDGGINCTDASVCQTSSADPSKVYKVGAYRHNPFTTQEINGFFAGFPHGETITKPDNSTCNVSVLFQLTCNHNVPWPVTTSKDGKPVASLVPNPIRVLYHEGPCSYQINLQYAGACITITPANDVTTMSAGTVLCILFICTLAGYFFLGCFVNCMRGKTGNEIIPNFEFWQSLPVNVAEGCNYTLTCSCCKEQGASKNASHYDSIE